MRYLTGFQLKTCCKKTLIFRPQHSNKPELTPKKTHHHAAFSKTFLLLSPKAPAFPPQKQALDETLWNKQKIIENLCNKTARKIWEEDTKIICKNFTEKRVKFIFCLFFGLNFEENVPKNTTVQWVFRCFCLVFGFTWNCAAHSYVSRETYNLMLIICRIFHISTRYFSRLFSIGLCLVLRPFVASLFFLGCARGFFYCHQISLPTCSSRLLLFCGFWGLVCVWLHDFFCGALLFFDFRRFLARLPFVCVVFTMLAANKHFFLTCLPPMSRGCSDVFQLFF